jgi:hypothetical protein
MIRVLSVVLLCAPALVAQWFSFGGKAGLVHNDSDAMPSAESKPYLLGPAVEFKLPIGFSIEASALYSRLGESFFSPANGEIGIGPTIWRARANSWEFPILAKKYLPEYRGDIRPFISGGYSFRRVSLDQFDVTVFGPQPLNITAPAVVQNPTTHGITAAAGVQFPFGRVKIAPEVRYTRWLTTPNTGMVVTEQKNKVGVLLGFTF